MKIANSLSHYPARTLLLWYTILILLGGLLLAAPISHVSGRAPVSLLDGIFTATSAVCVTGLTVRSTLNDFSWFGQFVIVMLIQVGGLGIMTLTTFIVLNVAGRREDHKQRVLIQETLGADKVGKLENVLRNVTWMTLWLEGLGAVLLAIRYLFDDLPLFTAIWHGIFHSIAAFCNAGFALHDSNMIPYQSDFLINVVIMVLIVMGGIGFPVLADLWDNRVHPWREAASRWRLHTKLVLLGTVMLIFLGAGLFWLFERDNILADKNAGEATLICFFQSITPRTAGFNTVDYAVLTNATIFLTILLMIVGAAPGSTGGGFKVSTLMVLVIQSIAQLRGERRLEIFRRSIDPETTHRAATAVLLYVVISTLGLLALLVAMPDPQPITSATRGFLTDALFEVVSALGTVGLSLGLTPNLSAPGKVIIILLMFVGRLGPISLVLAFSREPRRQLIEHPKEAVLIG